MRESNSSSAASNPVENLRPVGFESGASLDNESTNVSGTAAPKPSPGRRDGFLGTEFFSTIYSIYVGGAVHRPGKLPVDRPMTPLEAIMEAGGFDPDRARLAEVTVLRVEDGKQLTFRLNLKRVLQGTDPSPFYLKPFDVVHVPCRVFGL